MTCHFVERWNERGDGSIGGRKLMAILRRAVRDGDDAVAEFVFDRPSGPIYRFQSNAGRVFFCGVKNGWPATVFTARMMRSIRDNRKRDKGHKVKRRRGSWYL